MASPAESPGRVDPRLAQRDQIRQLVLKAAADRDGDLVAAALAVVRIVGVDEADRISARLAHANADFAEWRRQNPGAVKAVPRLRLRRIPRRGHVGARQARPGRRSSSRSTRAGPDPDPDDPEPPRRHLSLSLPIDEPQRVSA
jgi:hypothetical protein